jgi:hypothetical protein
MVQAADFGKLHDPPRRGKLDRPEVGCVLVEREVGTRLMVVSGVSGQDAAEVTIAEDENVIQALAPDRADEPFREGILPRALRRRKHLLDPHALQAAPKWLTVDAIAVAEEIGRRGLVWKGIHDLLSGPGGRGMLGHVEVNDTPAMVREHDENEEDAQARGGDGEEIDRNTRHVCDGGKRRFGSRRETVRSATSMPSLRSSPWILGAPQRGLAMAILLTSAVIAASTGGRPARGRPESVARSGGSGGAASSARSQE